MHFMPQVSLAGTSLRDVDILSDVLPEIDGDDNSEVIAKPVIPAAPTVTAKAGKPGEQTPAKKKKPCPPGTTCIIDYSGGGAYGMESFYKALDNVQKMNRPVRVAYWGDSFIESDIMTTDLRALLQDKYGGNGVGWVDCGKTTNSARPTVRVATNGFTSHSVMERKTFNTSQQGISQRYFTVAGSAQATFSGTTWNNHCGSWGTSTLYFKTSTPISITATMNDGEQKSFSIEAASNVQSVSVTGQMTKVKWAVNGANSSTQMAKVVEMLKRCYPNATILIVSMSDRDQRSGGEIKTMKGVEELVSYQQLLAADNKVAFFNLFEAMGGNGGISKMAQKGMAGKDYTHINFKGGAYLAKKLYDGIMAGK